MTRQHQIAGMRTPGMALGALLAVLGGLIGGPVGGPVGGLMGARSASAQPVSPVTIDDSPWAWELLQRARDQAVGNPMEAARQIDLLLNQYPLQLVPWPAEAGDAATVDRFRSVRAAANEILLAHPLVLERWRGIASNAARRRLDAGDAEGAVRHGLLTSAGFEAALRLAQLDLESGRFHGARRRLQEVLEHPDRRAPLAEGARGEGRIAAESDGRLALHALILEGMASAGAGDLDGAASALAVLRRSEGPLAAAGAAAVSRFLEDRVPPGGPLAITPLDPTDRPRFDDSEPRGAWQILAALPLPDSLASRAARGGDAPFQQAVATPMIERGSLLASAPTVFENSVVVNEGGVVRCFDRFGGRLRWKRDLVQMPQRLETPAQVDLSVVVPAGDSLLALSGHGTASGRAGGDRLVCLDAQTGAVRWQRSLNAPGRGGELEGFFPVGAPVVVDSAVCLFVRKVTGRLETMTYVVGLSLDDGSTRWIRHHSSSAGIRLGGQRPLTTLFARDGLLYAAAATGAVACLDPVDGGFRWLRRYPVPIREPLFESEPWEMGGAVPAEEFVAVVEPDQSAMSLLDREDGSTLVRRPIGRFEPTGQPRYFLTVPAAPERGLPELLVAVGSDVTIFEQGDLARPRWRLSSALPSPPAPGEERNGVRGRVQIAGRTLLIPMQSKVILVDADQESMRTILESTAPGVALLVDEQLLVAAADRLLISMPLSAAERILRRQIEERPGDPDRGLSLLALAIRAGSLPLAIEAAQATMVGLAAGVDRRTESAAREELVRLLLLANRRIEDSTEEDGLVLHDLLARAAVSPRQQCLSLIARSDWLARRGQGAEAVEIWQRMLGDPVLRRTMLPGEEFLGKPAEIASFLSEDRLAAGTAGLETGRGFEWRSAEVEVLDRLGRWRSRDPLIGAALEDAADRAFAGQGNDSGPRSLMAIARRFPGTTAGRRALRDAMERLIAADEASTALRLAGGAWRAAMMGKELGRAEAAEILAPMVDAALAAKAPGRAVALIDSMRQRLGDRAPTRLDLASGERSVESIRRQGTASSGADATGRPVLGTLSGEAVERPGRLLRPFAALGIAPPVLPSNSVLIHLEGALRRVDQTMSEQWALPFEDPDPRVLRFDDRDVLLWTSLGGDSKVAAIDAKSGALRWSSRRVQEIFPPAPVMASGDALLPNGGIFDPLETLPLLSGERLILVRRSGDVAMIDLNEGPEPVWNVRSPLVRVHSAWSDDATLILGGVDDRGQSVAMALDAGSGRETARWRPTIGSEVRWVLGTPDGMAIVATGGGIEAVDLDGIAVESDDQREDRDKDSESLPVAPEVLWLNDAPLARESLAGWLVGPWLLVADGLEGISAFTIAGGSLAVDRFDASPDVEGVYRLRDILMDDEGVVALFQERVVSYSLDGEVLGRDATAGARDFRTMVAGRDLLLLISAETPEQIETPLGRRTQYLYRIYQVDRSRGCKMVGPALQFASLVHRIDRVAAMDGQLLLSTGSSIAWIPMAGRPR